jgi:hypothetical protein
MKCKVPRAPPSSSSSRSPFVWPDFEDEDDDERTDRYRGE